MKANEFRIGNYLQDSKGRICKVEKLGTDWNENGIEAPVIKGALTMTPNVPIKLTKDVLLKFGIKPETKFNNFWLKYNKNKKDWRVYFKGTLIARVKYVHQFQNLYFALKNEELKINI